MLDRINSQEAKGYHQLLSWSSFITKENVKKTRHVVLDFSWHVSLANVYSFSRVYASDTALVCGSCAWRYHYHYKTFLFFLSLFLSSLFFCVQMLLWDDEHNEMNGCMNVRICTIVLLLCDYMSPRDSLCIYVCVKK